jgi:hypothetical protein
MQQKKGDFAFFAHFSPFCFNFSCVDTLFCLLFAKLDEVFDQLTTVHDTFTLIVKAGTLGVPLYAENG